MSAFSRRVWLFAGLIPAAILPAGVQTSPGNCAAVPKPAEPAAKVQPPNGAQNIDRTIDTPQPGALTQYKSVQLEGAQLEVDQFLQLGRAKLQYRVDGKGLTVAVIDSGLFAQHVDFDGRVLPGKNFTVPNPNADVADASGHGTFVAGLIAAGDVNIGVAPGAKVIPLKVVGGGGRDTYDAILDALTWVIDNRQKHDISVVNISLSDRSNYAAEANIEDDTQKKIAAKILELRKLRVAVTTAAGNYYHKFNDKTMQKVARQGMTFPAIVSATVSVGAVFDANNTPNPSPKVYKGGVGGWIKSIKRNRLCPFSQRLHLTVNSGGTDIFAPGAEMVSTGIDGAKGQAVYTEAGDGTSAAAPVVAGVILLMQQHHKRVMNELPTVDDLERWLREGGVDCADDHDDDDSVVHTTLTFRRLCALGALERLSSDIKQGHTDNVPK